MRAFIQHDPLIVWRKYDITKVPNWQKPLRRLMCLVRGHRLPDHYKGIRQTLTCHYCAYPYQVVGESITRHYFWYEGGTYEDLL